MKFVNMALSKTSVECLPSRISNYSTINYGERRIDDEVLETFCVIRQLKPTSIELINHIISGPNMAYTVIELADAWEAFFVLKGKIIQEIKDSDELMHFEDESSKHKNYLCAIGKMKGKHGSRQKFILKLLV